MRKTNRFALLLISALSGLILSGGAVAQRPATSVTVGRAGTNLAWPRAPRSASYRVGTVLLTMRNEVDRRDSSNLHRSLRIEMPGLPPFTIDPGADSAFPPSVMVVPNPRGAPLVLFQTFSGGAHCCTTITAIMPRGRRLGRVDIYEGDGGPIERAPRDVNGDGRIDFVFTDNAFLYAFASYAESFAPSRIVNIVDGRAVDVSTDRSLRRIYEGEIADARRACTVHGPEDNPNGACATYVALAARLGRFAAAWAEMLRAYRRNVDWDLPPGCRRVMPANQACPDADQIHYRDYPESLRNFLKEEGYIAG